MFATTNLEGPIFTRRITVSNSRCQISGNYRPCIMLFAVASLKGPLRVGLKIVVGLEAVGKLNAGRG
jgi:hypothetical protein